LLINRFLNGIHLRQPDAQEPRRVVCDPTCEQEIMMLKELIWHYVIRNSSLAALEYGQRRVIRDLFQIFRAEVNSV
jgi:dGTP triphosphohydrolase